MYTGGVSNQVTTTDMCIQHKDFAHLTQEDRFRIETLFGYLGQAPLIRKMCGIIFNKQYVLYVNKNYSTENANQWCLTPILTPISNINIQYLTPISISDSSVDSALFLCYIMNYDP